jgi:hypothetical protein
MMAKSALSLLLRNLSFYEVHDDDDAGAFRRNVRLTPAVAI